VREAVTNVVRHSDADECLLRLSRAPGGATELRITNDGVGAAAEPAPGARPGEGGGSGIAGLRERLTAVGGTLTTGHDGDRFTVTARVPHALRTAGEDA
jgi:two-component system sensor histidine kinase DesK